MFEKINRFLGDKNPYMVASLGIVLVSLLIITALLLNPADTDVETVLETLETTVFDETEEQCLKETETVIESEETANAETTTTEEEEPADGMETKSEGSESTKNAEETTETGEFPTTEEPGKSEKDQVIKEETKEQESSDPKVDITEEEAEQPEESKAEAEIEEPEEEPEEIPNEEPPSTPHEHSWVFESYYQNPTCSNGGLVNQICAHCGETQTTVGTPTGEHLYEMETRGDCCSAEVVICRECNHRMVKEKDPTNHIDEEDGFCYGCGQKTE